MNWIDVAINGEINNPVFFFAYDYGAIVFLLGDGTLYKLPTLEKLEKADKILFHNHIVALFHKYNSGILNGSEKAIYIHMTYDELENLSEIKGLALSPRIWPDDLYENKYRREYFDEKLKSVYASFLYYLENGKIHPPKNGSNRAPILQKKVKVSKPGEPERFITYSDESRLIVYTVEKGKLTIGYRNGISYTFPRFHSFMTECGFTPSDFLQKNRISVIGEHIFVRLQDENTPKQKVLITNESDLDKLLEEIRKDNPPYIHGNTMRQILEDGSETLEFLKSELEANS